ncbi:hypothetical protein HELRODRAFT_171069 [Helobdella robusta]|uniref:Uncharacterized protein n=1 Tax=Helobdella robusta TaxID=6412 RepID=T1F3S2_HELRO|nr:hypothetical protein HELRODRAFT_171069 [Helobdella robusta]ESO07027.1 hypothetical protein HELRODRAFT_171069 [Helobdella robusta]
MLLPDLESFDFNNEEKINNGICSKADAEDNSFSIMDLKPDIEENKLAIKNSKEKVKVDLSSFDSFLSLTFPCSSIYEGVPNLDSISDLNLSLPSDDDDESFDFGEMENITKVEKEKSGIKPKNLLRVSEYQELKMQYNLATKHRDRLLKDCYTLQNDLNSLTKRHFLDVGMDLFAIEPGHCNSSARHINHYTIAPPNLSNNNNKNDQRVEKQEWLKAKNSFASVYNGNKNNLNALEHEKKFEKVRLTIYNDFFSQKRPKGRNHIDRGTVPATNGKNFSPTHFDDDDDDLEIDCRASM